MKIPNRHISNNIFYVWDSNHLAIYAFHLTFAYGFFCYFATQKYTHTNTSRHTLTLTYSHAENAYHSVDIVGIIGVLADQRTITVTHIAYTLHLFNLDIHFTKIFECESKWIQKCHWKEKKWWGKWRVRQGSKIKEHRSFLPPNFIFGGSFRFNKAIIIIITIDLFETIRSSQRSNAICLQFFNHLWRHSSSLARKYAMNKSCN